MMDALGFKGIWKRPALSGKPDLVIQKLAGLQRETTRFQDARVWQPPMPGKHLLEAPIDLVHARFLSDTIVLAFAIKEFASVRTTGVSESIYKRSTKALAVQHVCTLASLLIAAAAKTDPALAYRGCVSCGDFEVHDNFLVGPAVDEAAESIDLAQGAFIWLLPSALDEFMEFAESVRSANHDGVNLPNLPYNVPLKGGNELSTYAVSPLAMSFTADERDVITSRITDTFVGRLEVHIKKQYTLQFLDACIADWKSPHA